MSEQTPVQRELAKAVLETIARSSSDVRAACGMGEQKYPRSLLFQMLTSDQQEQYLSRVAAMEEELAEWHRVRDGLPRTADGVLITLGMEVWVARRLGEVGPEFGYGRGPLNKTDDVYRAHVASIGCLGQVNRRVSMTDDYASFTHSAIHEGIFSTEAAAKQALEGAGDGK